MQCPLVELTCDDINRTPLYGNPAGHEVAGLVTALSQLLLHTTPVGLEFGRLDGGILRVSPITGGIPALASAGSQSEQGGARETQEGRSGS